MPRRLPNRSRGNPTLPAQRRYDASTSSDLYAIPHTHPLPESGILYEFKPLSPSIKETDLPQGSLIVTALPTTDRPGDQTQCIIWPGMKNIIMTQCGFRRPVEAVNSQSPAYRLDSSPGKGLGLFATRALIAGDLILSDRPLLIAPPKFKVTSINKSYEEMTSDERDLAIDSHLELILDVAIKRMIPENQEKYGTLSKAGAHGNAGALAQVFHNNGFELDGIDALMDISRREDQALCGVCAILGRLNHSCSPNTSYHFDAASFTFQLHAARDIPAGTELNMTYCDLRKPNASRRQDLLVYNFSCTCSACTNVELSDARRKQVDDILPPDMELNFFGSGWVTDSSLPDDYLISQSLRYISLTEEEGLEIDPDYRLHLFQLTTSYAALGDATRCQEYARKGAKACTACGDAENAVALTYAANRPTEGPLWQKRLNLTGRLAI